MKLNLGSKNESFLFHYVHTQARQVSNYFLLHLVEYVELLFLFLPNFALNLLVIWNFKMQKQTNHIHAKYLITYEKHPLWIPHRLDFLA